MTMRGIRGATTVDADDVQSVHAATRELVLAILEANPTLRPTDIASAFFTVTDDIRASHPAIRLMVRQPAAPHRVTS